MPLARFQKILSQSREVESTSQIRVGKHHGGRLRLAFDYSAYGTQHVPNKSESTICDERRREKLYFFSNNKLSLQRRNRGSGTCFSMTPLPIELKVIFYWRLIIVRLYWSSIAFNLLGLSELTIHAPTTPTSFPINAQPTMVYLSNWDKHKVNRLRQ